MITSVNCFLLCKADVSSSARTTVHCSVVTTSLKCWRQSNLDFLYSLPWVAAYISSVRRSYNNVLYSAKKWSWLKRFGWKRLKFYIVLFAYATDIYSTLEWAAMIFNFVIPFVGRSGRVRREQQILYRVCVLRCGQCLWNTLKLRTKQRVKTMIMQMGW